SSYKKDKIEIIVVDDGSTDNTLEVLKNYGIKVLKQEHLGKSKALNKGILVAKNEFVLVIDADTKIDKDFIKEVVRPFSDKRVGATTGIIKLSNNKGILPMFQNVEYGFYNLIRHSFSDLFKNSVWFLGALACYRKKIIKKIGLFKTDSLTEDIDIAMDINRAGYKNISVGKAFGYTNVPTSLKSLYKQRARWWIGALQSLFKNRDMFSSKYGIPTLFLFKNQIFWSIYALVYLPLLIYQVNYWLPYNLHSALAITIYLVRWFSLWGPLYVLYKLPTTGFSAFTFFGVLTGIMVTIMLLIALKKFKHKFNFKNLAAIFFFFPYTIVLNIIILLSLINVHIWKKRSFKR
ncbi:MAG TPA: glycosyltransferase, partial [Candidatus Nanoarchaeia archaeon]|nr:glycosyltransferase [Candidatus Nanoarchaeia archaeon]